VVPQAACIYGGRHEVGPYGVRLELRQQPAGVRIVVSIDPLVTLGTSRAPTAMYLRLTFPDLSSSPMKG